MTIASKSALVSITVQLGRAEAPVVVRALEDLQKSCSCEFDDHYGTRKASLTSCGIEYFVSTSPQCLELFRTWGGVDTLLSSKFVQLGLFTSTIQPIIFDANEGRNDIEEKTKKSKSPKSFYHAQRSNLLSNLLDCFALILEHSSLDTFSPSTSQSRQNIAYRLQSTCLRSIYRLLQFVDKSRETERSISRLLASLQTISIAFSTQFVNEFNFSLPRVHRLTDSVAFPVTTFKNSLRTGSDIISLGVLGRSISTMQEQQRICRSHVLRLYRLLLCIHDDTLTLRVLEIRNLTSRITCLLYMDKPDDCLAVLRSMNLNFFSNNWLPGPARARLCRPALLSDLARILSIYAVVIEGKESAIASSRTVTDRLRSATIEREVVATIETIFNAVLGKNGLLSKLHSGLRETLLEVCMHLPSLHLLQYQRLVLMILSVHPTLIGPLMNKIQLTTGFDPQPRLSNLWLKNAAFTVELMNLTQRALIQGELPITDHDHDLDLRNQTGNESLPEIVKSCCLSNFDNLSCAEHRVYNAEYWIEKSCQLKIEEEQQKRLFSIISTGESRLLTRSILTGAILNESDEIVFVGLTLISKLCECLRILERKFHSESGDDANRRILAIEQTKREVANSIPEISTFIQVLQRFVPTKETYQGKSIVAKTHQTLQTYELNTKDRKLPFDVKKLNTSRSTKKIEPQKEIEEYNNDEVTTMMKLPPNLFDEEDQEEIYGLTDLYNSSDDEEDEITLPGLIEIEKRNAASKRNDDDNVLPLEDVEYELNDLMTVFRNDEKRRFEDKLLKVDPNCLFSK